jgi:hypothetical protein
MAARASQRASRVAAAGVVAAFGLVSCLLGGLHLANLQSGFQGSEIAHVSSPRLTQVFLTSLDMSTPEAVEDSTNRFATRIANLTLPQRRRLMQAMAQPQFWTQLSKDIRVWTQLQSMALQGVERAALELPAAGDLWLAVARMRVNVSGFDDVSRRALELSHAYSPKEIDLAIGRLDIAAQNVSFYDDGMKLKVMQDLDLLRQTFPARAEELVARLRQAGLNGL